MGAGAGHRWSHGGCCLLPPGPVLCQAGASQGNGTTGALPAGVVASPPLPSLPLRALALASSAAHSGPSPARRSRSSRAMPGGTRPALAMRISSFRLATSALMKLSNCGEKRIAALS